MKKLIFVLSVVLVLVFSCVLTSFADDSVVSGYAVDNVPYNESFDGVLTVSDSGSQLYSSSYDKTYKTSSVLSAPSSSSQPLFSAKSITDMIYKNIWRGDNSPSITFPVLDGFTGVKYVWSSSSESSPNSYSHLNEARIFTFFKSERKYRVTFTLSIKSNVKGNFAFFLAVPTDRSNPVIPLCSYEARIGTGNNLGQASRSYSLEFTTPNGIDELVPVVKGGVYGSSLEFYINNFTVIDITTEDLDNSLNKLGDRFENSIDPSVPYNEFDDGSFKDSADELKEAENALPTVDFNAIDELASSVDVSSYAQAFSGINQLFIRVVDTIGITPLIFFACFFGFCIFLIGRKLSGG